MSLEPAGEGPPPGRTAFGSREAAGGPGTGYSFVTRRRRAPEADRIDRAFVRDLDGEGAGRLRILPAAALARGIGRRAAGEEIEDRRRRRRPAGLGHEGMPALVASGPVAAGLVSPLLAAPRKPA